MKIQFTNGESHIARKDSWQQSDWNVTSKNAKSDGTY